jgi:Domain of unknown function (DUF4962)/Heparinase II/III-like protein
MFFLYSTKSKRELEHVGRLGVLMLAIATILLSSITSISRADTRATNSSNNPIVPFEELLKRPVKLRPVLSGQHPRIFFTNESLKLLSQRAQNSDRELWQAVSKDVRALKMAPPPPGSPMLNRSGVEQVEGDFSQYDVAYILAEATFAYAIERDPRYLEAARRWLLTIIKYDPWGYTFRTPNVDLPPAHLLYAVGFAYDALYNDLTTAERDAVRAKLARQARLMYEFFSYKPGKKYSYSQNHTFIPMAGLGVAAFALMDEEPDAEQWARLARAVFERVLTTFGTDGYYYEGFHYSVFSVHWIVRYLDALEHATGEDLYPRMREKFLPLKYYVAHSILPDGRSVFDFGDTGRGAAERDNSKNGKLNTGYEVLYRLAAKYNDAEAQGIADWLRLNLKTTTWEKGWAFHAHDPQIRAAPMSSVPASYYFRDNETAFWRSNWEAGATAFAFRCGPPEGHHVTELSPLVPDWRQNTGHAHPDANSFIIYSHGKYLTGDTGYTGIKQTKHHNTILVDGRGQEKDGRHEVFKDVPYERLNKLRLADLWSTPEFFYARGLAAPAYFSDLNLGRFDRHFLYVAPDYFVIWDELAADVPRVYTWLLNAEKSIVTQTSNSFVMPNGNAELFAQCLLPNPVTFKVEPLIVTTQGRPGEVEKGELEQRGVQLVERNAEPSRHAVFLHFMMVNGKLVKGERPRVSALQGTAQGFRIQWPNGETEIVLLRGSDEGLSMNGERAVVRVSPKGAWQRLILQSGTRLSRGSTELLHSVKPVSVAFDMTGRSTLERKVRGTLYAETPTVVSVRAPVKPHGMRINGGDVKSQYDGTTDMVSFTVGAGTSVIEWDL